MRHQVSVLVIAAALSAALSGCNTMVEKSFQKVKIVTPEVTGADCMLDTGKQRYRVVTPGETLVERSPHKMTITCEKAYYHTARLKIEPSIHAWHGMWNTLNGVVPGTAWDIATNSVHDYPDVIEIEMEPDPDALKAVTDDFSEPAAPPAKKQSEDFESADTGTPVADETFGGSLRK